MSKKTERCRMLMFPVVVVPLMVLALAGFVVWERLGLEGGPARVFLDEETGLMDSVPAIAGRVAVRVAIPVALVAAILPLAAVTIVLYVRILRRYLSREELLQVFDEPFNLPWMGKYVDRRVAQLIGDAPDRREE
jgi:hypothetical protein